MNYFKSTAKPKVKKASVFKERMDFIQKIISLSKNEKGLLSEIDLYISRLVEQKNNEPYEFYLQVAVCKYLELHYPNVLFISGLTGVKMHPFIVKKLQYIHKDYFRIPDLQILQSNEKYIGLFIELKTLENTPFLKNSDKFRSDIHVKEQSESLEKLYKKGYFATFGVGFTASQIIIDNYLKQ